MRKQIVYTLLVVFVCANSSNAQTSAIGEFNKLVMQNWAGDYTRVGAYKVKGSPYFLGESFSGTITYKDGTKSDTRILYDLYNQKAGADFKNGILETEQAVSEFTMTLPAKFEGKTLVFKSSETFGDKSSKSYYNILDDGSKVALLKMFKIKVVADPANMMDKEVKVFEQFYEYYLYNKATKELSKFKPREKDLAKILGDQEFVKGNIEKNGLDVSQETDLVKLVNAYNSK